jgi:DNA-binding NtrC family response regulator
MERRHIGRVLSEVGGHRSRAAQLLGISERNLYRKIHEHRLDEDRLDEKNGGAANGGSAES